MRALVIYESMYGNTHAIATAIAKGLEPHGEVRLMPVKDATAELVAWAELVVAGGPTHAHGMSRQGTRAGAAERVGKPDSTLAIDPDATGPGIRDWLAGLEPAEGKRAAAFDTRIDLPALLTGRASSGIANGMRRHGFTLAVDPESFLVDKQSALLPGEMERATRWGAGLGAVFVPVA